MTVLALPVSRLRRLLPVTEPGHPSHQTRSLRLRLVLSFSLLVLGATVFAAWLSLTMLEQRHESRLDARLGASLEAARAEFRVAVGEAEVRLAALARRPAVQAAFASGDRAGLRALLGRERGVDAIVTGEPLLGLPARDVVRRELGLVRAGARIGTLVAVVPLDGALLARLRTAAGLPAGDGLVLLRDGRILGAPARVDRVAALERDGDVAIAGQRFRPARALLVGGTPPTQLVALAPTAPLDAAMTEARRWAVLCLLLTLFTLALLARVIAGPVFRPIAELARHARHSLTDALTGLPNRRAFEAEAEAERERAERLGHPLALVLLDIDNFKRVNDTFGHGAGDEVLRETARILREAVREIDLPVRHGGEEFAILLPGSDARHARRVAERVRAALEEREIKVGRGESVSVTASFGVAAGDGRVAFERLLEAADRALYRAKGSGKNRVRASADLAG